MPIELVHGFLAISADMYPDGRFSLIGGGFDALEVPSFPATVLSLAIIARVRVPIREDDRPHQVRVLIYRPDGTLMQEAGPTILEAVVRPGPRIGPLELGI